MNRVHRYAVEVEWQGNRGTGTSGYREYDRTSEIRIAGKPPIPGSSDRAFRGDPARWSAEDLLVASLSECHMLWYLHLAAVAGVVVTGYTDVAEGTMAEEPDGAGQFTEVVLRPAVVVADASMAERAGPIHEQAHEKCFVARSVNFPVRIEPEVRVAGS